MADRSSLVLRLDSMFTFSLSDISHEFKHFGRDSIESVRQAIDCLLHECPWGVCRSRVLQSKHKHGLERHIHSLQDTWRRRLCCGHTHRPHSGWSSRRPPLPERPHAAAAGSPIVPDHWLFPRGMSRYVFKSVTSCCTPTTNCILTQATSQLTLNAIKQCKNFITGHSCTMVSMFIHNFAKEKFYLLWLETTGIVFTCEAMLSLYMPWQFRLSIRPSVTHVICGETS